MALEGLLYFRRDLSHWTGKHQDKVPFFKDASSDGETGHIFRPLQHNLGTAMMEIFINCNKKERRSTWDYIRVGRDQGQCWEEVSLGLTLQWGCFQTESFQTWGSHVWWRDQHMWRNGRMRARTEISEVQIVWYKWERRGDWLNRYEQRVKGVAHLAKEFIFIL